MASPWTVALRRELEAQPWGAVFALIFTFFVLKTFYTALFASGFGYVYPAITHSLSKLVGSQSLDFGELPYHQTSILLAALGHPLFAASLVVGLAVLAAGYRHITWKAIGASWGSRGVTFALALILAWPMVSYDYNLFFDQAHVADRWILLLLAGLTVVHPGWTAPFTVQLLLVTSQFDHPLASVSTTPLYPALNLMLLGIAALYLELFARSRGAVGMGLFCAGFGLLTLALPPALFPTWMGLGFLALWLARRSIRSWPAAERQRAFSLVALTLVAAGYAVSGLKKLTLGAYPGAWVWNHDLSHLVAYRFSGGWLASLDPQRRASLLAAIDSSDTALLFVALVIEIATMFMVVDRRLACWILVGCTALHVGIFACLGILFWQWLLVDLLLAVAIARGWARSIFSWRALFVSVPLVLLAPLIFRPPVLAWLDTPLSYRLELEVVGESGRVYGLESRFMDPYHRLFTGDGAIYLIDEPLVLYPQGTRDAALAAAIERGGPEGLAQLKRERGTIYADATRSTTFDHLIRTFFSRLEARGDKRVRGWSAVGAPYRSYDALDAPFRRQEPVSAVRVRLIEQFATGGEMLVLQNRVLREIEIPPVVGDETPHGDALDFRETPSRVMTNLNP
jgi:hypothetical protein